MIDSDRRDTIVRFKPAERINHWIVAISFVLVALSGLALFHPAMFWLANFFGGGPWARILHPFFGLLLVIAFLFLVLRMLASNWMQQRDWAWLRQWRDVVRNHEEAAPEVGRFNGGQKLLFFVLLVCVLGLFLSGLIIWRPYIAAFFPVGLIRLAALVHAICALLMICSIIVHIYAGFWVKGSIRAMTKGTVTPGWAWKHHRAWLREIFARSHHD